MKILLVSLFISILFCAGCGQTGPLTLPNDNKPEKTDSEQTKPQKTRLEKTTSK